MTLFQALTNVSTYFSDQLESEQHNDDLVSQGRMNASQAHRLNDEWEEREWSKRWKEDFPQKVLIGLGKYHAMIICMRFYETVVCEKILNVDNVTLDRLTLDLFKYSLRRKEEQEEVRNRDKNNQTHYTHPTDKDKATDSFGAIMKTCLWANLIGFAADCTVQQCILFYMYARYWLRKRARNEASLMDSLDQGKDKKNGDNVLAPDSIDGGMFLSLLLKSTKLLFYRGMALVCSSFGGAIGCLLYPGYGMLFGSQLGDAVSGALSD